MNDVIVKTFFRSRNIELFLNLEGTLSVRAATKKSRVSHPWGQHLVWMWRKNGLVAKSKDAKYVYTVSGKELERVFRSLGRM